MSAVANGGTLVWRMGELERRLNEIKPEALVTEVTLLRTEMKAVKRLQWALILSVVGGSLSLTLTLLSGLGHA